MEVLESLSHQNFAMPAPRLIDPAVFYDLVKIRKLVDEAAHDSVRASTGVSHNAGNVSMEFLGAGGGNVSSLSRQRVLKIRQKAAKLLAEAYALDEVAASVATMQATSTLEDLGSHVLKKEPSNPGRLNVETCREAALYLTSLFRRKIRTFLSRKDSFSRHGTIHHARGDK
jgi:hypothetical protein